MRLTVKATEINLKEAKQPYEITDNVGVCKDKYIS